MGMMMNSDDGVVYLQIITWPQVSRWVWNCLSALTGRRGTVLGLEYVELMRQAAQRDTRVVLGDRDLPLTINR